MPTLKVILLLVSIMGVAMSLLLMFYNQWAGFLLFIVNFYCAIDFAIHGNQSCQRRRQRGRKELATYEAFS